MKKKVMGIVAIVAIIAFVGYNIYTSQNNMKLSSLALANVEALARYEYPDVEITCNQSKYDSPGQCWTEYSYCLWFPDQNTCQFTGDMSDSCYTYCD